MADALNIKVKKAAITLGDALQAHGYMLALAESCTGGMVAEAMTSVAGSSAWFDRGFITYSNTAKVDMLDVAHATLETYGAVSEQTAAEMALGALRNSTAEICGSITGIAGPTGGTSNKPVGTVCFGWAGRHFPVMTCTQRFEGDRQCIRQQATLFLLSRLLEAIRPNSL